MLRAHRISSLVSLAAIAALAVLAAGGCGSDGEESGYGPEDTTGEEQTATATTPAAPPGAAARACGRTTVAGTEGLRVTGIGCDVGRGVVAGWSKQASCAPRGEASRVSCEVYDEYRCLAAVVEDGVAVSCSRPGGSLAFLAKR
jgi:hypothetical protein